MTLLPDDPPGDDVAVDVFSELAGALPAVGPVAGPLARRLGDALQREWRRNASSVLKLACQHAGLSREDLAERVEQHPELVPLITRVLYEGGMTGADRPLRILAGYLGNAIADPTQIDDVAVILGAINGLAEPHVRLLEMLSVPMYEGSVRWHRGSVHGRSPYRPEVTTSAFRKLIDAGLVDDGSLRGQLLSDSAVPTIEVTPMGRDVLAVLQTVSGLETD
jgi:hypothetical protein